MLTKSCICILAGMENGLDLQSPQIIQRYIGTGLLVICSSSKYMVNITPVDYRRWQFLYWQYDDGSITTVVNFKLTSIRSSKALRYISPESGKLDIGVKISRLRQMIFWIQSEDFLWIFYFADAYQIKGMQVLPQLPYIKTSDFSSIGMMRTNTHWNA